jgi:hypothetical protein
VRPVLVVDVDGTVCDSLAITDKLAGYFHAALNSWDDYQMLACLEEAGKQPIVPGAEVLPILMREGMCDVVFLTGRAEGLGRARKNGRRLTTDWLRGTLGIPAHDIRLFMRQKNDRRTNDVVKADVFIRQVLPLFKRRMFVFLDDDASVLTMYTRHGLALKSPECWAALSYLLPK